MTAKGSNMTSLSGVLAFLFLITLPTHAVENGGKSDKMKQRLEQLFIWRVSDKLSLTPKEEALFVSEYKKLNDERLKLSSQTEEVLTQIEKSKDDSKKSQTLLKEYMELQGKMTQLPNKEIQNIEKLFGSKKAAEYVLIKKDMTQKLKEALTSTDRSSASTAP